MGEKYLLVGIYEEKLNQCNPHKAVSADSMVNSDTTAAAGLMETVATETAAHVIL